MIGGQASKNSGEYLTIPMSSLLLMLLSGVDFNQLYVKDASTSMNSIKPYFTAVPYIITCFYLWFVSKDICLVIICCAWTRNFLAIHESEDLQKGISSKLWNSAIYIFEIRKNIFGNSCCGMLSCRIANLLVQLEEVRIILFSKQGFSINSADVNR